MTDPTPQTALARLDEVLARMPFEAFAECSFAERVEEALRMARAVLASEPQAPKEVMPNELATRGRGEAAGHPAAAVSASVGTGAVVAQEAAPPLNHPRVQIFIREIVACAEEADSGKEDAKDNAETLAKIAYALGQQEQAATAKQAALLAALAEAPAPPDLSGLALIAIERERQVSGEGWTAAHDDEHESGELGQAAICYIDKAAPNDWSNRCDWPFDRSWWKPSDDPVRNLVKAGALIAAEIDRVLRQQATTSASHPAGTPAQE